MPNKPAHPNLFTEEEVRKFMEEHKVMNRSDITITEDGYLIKGLTAQQWDNLWEKGDNNRFND